MNPVRRAVIDVGTNSIKLLVAEVRGVDVNPLLESSKQTRLGQGFYEAHVLQPSAISATVEAVAAFMVEARSLQVDSIRVIATSAAREAVNAPALTSAITHVTGFEVEIITGEKEADWVFRGTITDPVLARHPLLLLDVGGGSTEFILGSSGHQSFRSSFPLGTLRLLETVAHGNPPTSGEYQDCRERIRAFLESKVEPDLGPALARVGKSGPEGGLIQLIGTGGTATILARIESRLEGYDRTRIEATRLSLDRIQENARHLWSLPLEERKQIVGLPPNRADVILTGVTIYESVMAVFNFAELRVSTRGLRWAALMDD